MSGESFLNGRVTLHAGDSRDVLKTLADNSIDSIVTDPPYALVSIVKRFANSPRSERTENTENPYGRTCRGFMGQRWDTGETAFAVDFWTECLRVLKPGGHVVAFSGTRTYHRMACAIEDAGFEVRDMLSWLYGSGFPKSHDVSKGIDKSLGAERTKIRIPASDLKNPPNLVGGAVKGDDRPWRESAMARGFHEAVSDEAVSDEAVSDEAVEWQGWGTALKPACEPICFGRKPLIGTVARNVMEHGTGAINVNACRVGSDGGTSKSTSKSSTVSVGAFLNAEAGVPIDAGRWPANVIHDGSAEVIAGFPESASSASSASSAEPNYKNQVYGRGMGGTVSPDNQYSDAGSAARYFYTAKADADDRLGSKHPTVKPVDLMQWLCRIVTPPGGTVLDPFAGTGTTGEAAFREGFKAVLIEREPEYQADIRRRMALVMAGPEERKRESIKAKIGDLPFEPGSLFAQTPEVAE